MKQLDKYVGNSVLWSFVAVMFILLGLDYILSFIEHIKRINQHYGLADLSAVLLLHLPKKLTEYIPIASLIGTLIGLGALANTSELTVIRAAGVPLWRIGLSAIKPLFLVSLIGLGISEFISPVTEQEANLRESLRRQSNNDYVLTGGAWLRSEQSFIYIHAADAKGTLYNIETFKQNQSHELESTLKAKKAIYQGDNLWLLHDASHSYFLGNKINTEYSGSKVWEMSFKPEHLFLATQEIDALSLSQSLAYQGYLSTQGLDTSQYQLDFWTKTLRPLATIALVIVALSSVFGPLRSSTMGGRVFSGVIIGIIFQNGLNLFGRVSLVADFSPLLGILIPIGICFAMGIWQLKRLR
ncbi:LPS export ABC transporter permease LptG [Marinomonas agarivorans]|nr:LPS export ABC transporter permease LptG [Marinomonas agarivorans]